MCSFIRQTKMCGCTPPTDPNVQGRPEYFFKINQIEKKKKKSNFLPKVVFLKILKHETYQTNNKNVLFFIKYSWQAFLMCNKPFDLLKILVFDFTLSFELQNDKICKKKNWTKNNKKSDRLARSYQTNNKNVLFFIKYSWQAFLMCNKPFDLLKILVFDFTLSFELQNDKTMSVWHGKIT